MIIFMMCGVVFTSAYYACEKSLFVVLACLSFGIASLCYGTLRNKVDELEKLVKGDEKNDVCSG